MSKLTKAEAARLNGAKSKGPVTPEGKARSAKNSFKHGMYSGVFVVAPEDEKTFHDYLNGYLNFYHPQEVVECDLVDDIVIARWRILRGQCYETALLDRKIEQILPSLQRDCKPGAVLEYNTVAAVACEKLTSGASSALTQIWRQESRLYRIVNQATQALERVQKQRRAANQQPVPVPEPVPAAASRPKLAVVPKPAPEKAQFKPRTNLFRIGRNPRFLEMCRPLPGFSAPKDSTIEFPMM